MDHIQILRNIIEKTSQYKTRLYIVCIYTLQYNLCEDKNMAVITFWLPLGY